MRACWLKWVGRDWSISADYIWLNYSGANIEAARRAAANYTLAVPQFYGGRIQLLLPLCLTGDKPELALTIQREDGFYAARTCLTLDMAYNNARLICRPETSWIKR